MMDRERFDYIIVGGHKYTAEISYIKKLVLANISQLLLIAMGNSDENIEEHYGGERALIELIDCYMTFYVRVCRVEEWKGSKE